MPRAASGEPRTGEVRVTKPNGSIYVYERVYEYDPATGTERQIRSKLKGKILPGSDEIVPTRPKRPPKSGAEDCPQHDVQAKRQRVGMMEILDHIGKESGIDDLLYKNVDRGTAQKIISVARFLAATDGGPLPDLVTFQFGHPLPYEDGLSEGIYHDLFCCVGRDASLEQSFFEGRCRLLGASPAVAYDSTTISTCSEQHTEAQHVRGKENDGLRKIKFLVLYEVETRQPIIFRRLKGNISDMTTVSYAIRQLETFGVRGPELITDSGYNGQENIANLLLAGFHFITPIETSQKWVQKAIDEHLDLNNDPYAVIPFDPAVHGVCLPQMHSFKRKRLYGSSAKGLKKGDLESVRHPVYLHLYFDINRKAEEDIAFDEKLLAARDALQAGTPMEALGEQLQSVAFMYLSVTKRGDKITVGYKTDAIAAARRRHGFFALLSNKRKDSAECLRQYRKRVYIELFFEAYKGRTGGRRPRAWSADALQGRMFVQFVALCYREYFASCIRTMIEELGEPNGDPKHDLKTNLDNERKLRNWLQDKSLHFVLNWFDTAECTSISTKLRQKRLRSEITARDQLFLTKLGVHKEF